MPRALPQLGPAVGPGAIAVQHVPAQNLDAVCNLARHAVPSSIFADYILWLQGAEQFEIGG